MPVAIPTPHKFFSLYREILHLSHSTETESLEAKKSMKDVLVFRAVCCLSLRIERVMPKLSSFVNSLKGEIVCGKRQIDKQGLLKSRNRKTTQKFLRRL